MTPGGRRVRGPVVGLFGGSFDPVHRGHLEIARRARDQAGCEEVWFVPAGRAVHKPEGAHAGAEARVEMIERALRGSHGLRVERIEVDAGRPCRSIETVRALAARWPGTRWRLILGEDSWDALDSWVQPEELLTLAPPVVQARPGARGAGPALAARHPPFWLRGEPVDASSTDIRAALARGEAPEELPPEVLDYVRRHALYREA